MISGLIGAGAAQGLEELLARQLLEAQQAERERAQRAQEALTTRRLDQDASQHGDSVRLQERGLDQQDRARRDVNNRAGLQDMLAQRQIMDREAAAKQAADAETQLLEQFAQLPGLTEAQRAVVTAAIRGGRDVNLSDVKTPDDFKQEDDRAVSRAGRIARAQADARPPSASTSEPKRHPHVINGKTVYLTEDEVNQMGGVTPPPRERPVTGQDRNNLGFYLRAKQAEDIVTPLEGDIAKMGLLGQAELEYAPNFVQPEKNQMYRQAQRAFTEARLRKESGAAIPQSEYENDSRTYFAQPGDSEKVIKQKQQARKMVLDSLASSSGRAWDEHFGEPRQTGTRRKFDAQGREIKE